MTITRAEAARELQIRRAARVNVVGFAEAIDVPGRPIGDDPDVEDGDSELIPFEAVETKMALHHHLILEAMERCVQRDTGRTMLFMPPGSAKSTYASVVFPADYLGRFARRKVGLFSYGGILARKFGRRTRSIIKQARYKGIHRFTVDGETVGVELSDESSAVDNFVLNNESEYMAAGMLGGVTGNRMNLAIIDDPVKGREQAESETIRDKTYEAYQDDVLTRLVPGGSLVIIQTRWHEDDLSGRILPEGWNGESGMILGKDGNEWEVLCIQAECQTDTDPLGRKRGEMLWPEWFTEKHWAQHRVNPRTWGALFQQRPTPLDGNMFKPDMIQTIDALPAGRIVWVRGWDLAACENDGDFTAGFKLGRHEDGRFIIADLTHGQWGPDGRDARIKATAQADGKRCVQDMPQDPGAAGKTQIVAMGKLLVGFPMVFGPESGDKETRAEPFAAQVNIGNVYMVRADWNGRVKSELRAFPSGTFDDIVDAASRAFARLLERRGPMVVNAGAVSKMGQR